MILRFHDPFLRSKFILYFPCRVKNMFLTTLAGWTTLRRGGGISDFPSSSLGENTQVSIPTQVLELLSGENTLGQRIYKKKSEEFIKKRGSREGRLQVKKKRVKKP